MALLEWGSRRFAIPAGEVTVGSDSACAIQVSEPQVLARHAVLASQPDGQVAIRRAVPEADIVINGVRQGGEPTPLLHGDKVELGGVELTFVDERRSGSTQYIQALQVPQAAARAKADARSGMPTGNTGGRVVSLTDGREYAVTGSSLVFGREAGCDVVVTGKDVSRRHAEIMATPKGYLLVDSSTNGTFVNEERLQGQRILMRADVIRVGEETFRFYADPAPQPAGAPPPPPPRRRPRAPAGHRVRPPQRQAWGGRHSDRSPFRRRPDGQLPGAQRRAQRPAPDRADTGRQYRARGVQRPGGAGGVGFHRPRQAATARGCVGAVGPGVH